MRAKSARPFSASCIGVAILCALASAAATAAESYARMAPVAQYLMGEAQVEIALARSAAPAAVSGNATVLVLKPKGYEIAVTGTNGFTCLVERAWMQPFDSPEFWNPKMRAPICYNPAATRSILRYTLGRTKLALEGHSKEKILDEVRAALARNELQQPEPGAMSFMMSKEGNLGDATGHWHSHLMFHVPKAAAATWGANLPGSPVVLDLHESPEPQTIFLVPVGHWSDGTEAPGS